MRLHGGNLYQTLIPTQKNELNSICWVRIRDTETCN